MESNLTLIFHNYRLGRLEEENQLT